MIMTMLIITAYKKHNKNLIPKPWSTTIPTLISDDSIENKFKGLLSIIGHC